MIAQFPDFTLISNSNVNEIAELARGYAQHANFSPVVLWCWNRGYPGGVSRLYGNLVVRWRDPLLGKPFISFTARDTVRQTVAMLLDYADNQGLSPCLRAIPATRQDVLPCIDDDFAVTEDRDNFEYLLSVNDWAELRGARFRNRRHTMYRLERDLDISLRELSLADEAAQADIDRLIHRWAEQRGIAEADFLPELTAIRNLFDYISSNGVFVLGAYAEDTLVGFSINEHVTGEIGIGHFAKADYAHPGISTYLLHHVCLRLRQQGVKTLNIEEDLGDPGLRKAKLLLKPVCMLEKVMICRRALPSPGRSDAERK